MLTATDDRSSHIKKQQK